MGLDIYLYTREQAEQNDRHDEASGKFYGREDYDSLDAEEKERLRAEIPSYASWTTVRSERYPEHLFNRRYLRSSYNGGGFNHAVPEFLGSASSDYPNDRGSLYWIFSPLGREWDGDAGNVTADDVPALREAKQRALDVADGLRKCDPLRVVTVSPNMFREPPKVTDSQALRMYRQQVADGRIEPGSWWSNVDMDVFGDGLTVLAAIPGAATFGVPGVHLIYRAQGEGVDSYIQSAEITAEFCDEAIALIERDGGARISWSG